MALDLFQALTQVQPGFFRQRFAAQRKMLGLQFTAFAQQHRPLHQALELTHVAREGVARQMIEGSLRPAHRGALQEGAGLGSEVPGQFEDVAFALAQGR
ncbi:hypothetical protein D3C72_2104260 [compost metagenome]